MDPNDPEDTPTRPGGEPLPPARSPDEERTLPAGSRGRPTGGPGKPPPSKPAPAAQPAGKPSAGPADPLLGKELGGCLIEKLLGKGAMGAVYKARQQKLDRDVAIKVIRPEMMTDQRMLKRFELEARTVGKFNSANVVMVHDVGFELGVHYLVMEFVQGKNLRDHVRLLAGGRLPVGEALPLLRQSIKGLEEAKRLEVIHRDIKPDNLMITDRGVLKIADFGIAKPIAEDFSMTLTSELVGTPLYMSPEQCQGSGDLDFRSDMYSLGATFYYLLTGEPPIRASSVYELIQTKTKMASLCLWKALPGLDENNPLSRVIERMTALDRDDRYASYEELLNDLVLVEHGQTIQVVKPGAASARARAAKAKGKRTVSIAVAALLLAGGGGAAWWFLGQPGDPGGGGGVVDPQRAVASRLRELWTRLGEAGPTPALRDAAGALAAGAEHAGERDRLLREIENGIALQAELAAAKRPAVMALPFDDVRAHFAAVDAIAARHPTGTELATWRARAVQAARAEDDLARSALVTLTSAWALWQTDRGKAGGDALRVSDLAGRLDGIEQARAALVALVPAQAVAVQNALSVEAIANARRDLANTGNGASGDVDVGEVLAQCRDELQRTGPNKDLRERLDRLQPTRREQIETQGALQNAMETARVASEQATLLQTTQKPDPPIPPFDDVLRYWQGLDRALAPVTGVDGSLPPWASRLKVELRAVPALQPLVVAACIAAFTRWEQRPAGGDAAGELAAVSAARARAIELFPEAAAELDQRLPATRLATAATAVAQQQQRTQWLADGAEATRQFAQPLTLAEWAAAAPRLVATLEGLRARAAPFVGEGEIDTVVQRLAGVAERWSTAQSRVQTIDKHLGAGELKAADGVARVASAAVEGRTEFLAAGEVVVKCTDAFGALERNLAIDEAMTLLRAAYEKARGTTYLPLGEQRLRSWIGALERLQLASSGMVPIPGGRPKGGLQPVESFFLAATECSGEEFARFQAELRDAVAGRADAQQRFAAVESRFPGIGMTPDRLQELLDFRARDNKLPVENVTWHGAAACALWHGRALPTAAEWSLAAFGDGGKHEFPWGNGWSNDRQQRNPSDQSAAEVADGGLSWRQADGLRIHHLGGTVAEWLAAEAGARVAFLAGGRYSDRSDSSVKEQAGGRLFEADKGDGRKGFGFRTVLRPRQFPGLDWPK